jgi:adenylosuccinate synthase
VLAGLEELKICVGYELNGQKYYTLPADSDDLALVKPIYETLPGFMEPLGDIRTYDALPATAKAYVDCVEQHINVKIPMVCVGRRRDQILFR